MFKGSGKSGRQFWVEVNIFEHMDDVEDKIDVDNDITNDDMEDDNDNMYDDDVVLGSRF